jgi:uncharacterized membrane protein
MRSITIQLPRGNEHRLLLLAREHGGSGERVSHGWGADGDDLAVIEMQLPNDRLGDFVSASIEAAPEVRFTFEPTGVLAIEPPLGEIREAVLDVSRRSTLEVVLGALQSIGSWRGLLVYALLSGVVAAYAVIFNIPYLLPAAMLISPMGGPVMVAVIAIATGDTGMLRRGLIRFWVAVSLLAGAAAIMGAVYGLDFSTATMEMISSLSSWVLLIAVAGGAAGALAQIQSERDSLVTATATGFLVAVSLSPPAAVLGLGVVIGRWDYVAQMAVLLLLTFFGILAGGALTLVSFGVGPDAPPAVRGSRLARAWMAAIVILGGGALFLWQSGSSPEFQKADLSRDAVRVTREAIRERVEVRLLQVNAAFTRPELSDSEGEALLIQAWITSAPGTSEAQLESAANALRGRIAARVTSELPGVAPFVDVTTLPPPR